MLEHEVDHRFDFHPANSEEKKGEHGSVREGCKALAHFLNGKLPEGREKALAMTALEECMFWSNASIARSLGGFGD